MLRLTIALSCLVAWACARPTAIGPNAAGTYTLDPSWPSFTGTMPAPSGVDVDPVAGEVYMCSQTGSPSVTVWSTHTGKLLRSWGDDTLDTPHGIRIKMPLGKLGPQGNVSGTPEIWVADTGAKNFTGPRAGHVLKAFTPEGKVIRIVGQPGISGTGLDPVQFGNVADVAWNDKQTKMVVADGDGGPNNRVVEFNTANGRYNLLASWGGYGNTAGKFNISHGIAVDQCDRVWVADRANSRLQIFDLGGHALASWSCFSISPYGVRVFPSGSGEQSSAAGRVLVTGHNPISGANQVMIIPFHADCDSAATLGDCKVATSIMHPTDTPPTSLAHFSAIDHSTQDIYLAEVGTGGKFVKYKFHAGVSW